MTECGRTKKTQVHTIFPCVFFKLSLPEGLGKIREMVFLGQGNIDQKEVRKKNRPLQLRKKKKKKFSIK